jgi:hypothetical protein
MKKVFVVALLCLVVAGLKGQNQPGSFPDSIVCSRVPNHPLCNPVPVVLKELRISLQNDAPVLTWEIVSEKDNDHFEILRSKDGIHWYEVAIISGRGTTNEPKTYTWTDNNRRLNGKVYYMIRQVDYDQTTKILVVKIIYLDFRMLEGFKVQGNPVRYGYYDMQGRESENTEGVRVLHIITTEGSYTYKVIIKN